MEFKEKRLRGQVWPYTKKQLRTKKCCICIPKKKGFDQVRHDYYKKKSEEFKYFKALGFKE